MKRIRLASWIFGALLLAIAAAGIRQVDAGASDKACERLRAHWDERDCCNDAHSSCDGIRRALEATGCEVPSCGPPTGSFCGGIAGIPCPTGQRCIDDPSDGCDPNAGDADCAGICVAP